MTLLAKRRVYPEFIDFSLVLDFYFVSYNFAFFKVTLFPCRTTKGALPVIKAWY